MESKTQNANVLTFIDTLRDAEKKYQSKIPEKGESWKTLSLMKLRSLLYHGEVREWAETMANKESNEREREELLDIINVACMLATRLEEKITSDTPATDFVNNVIAGGFRGGKK